eukprot:435671_1
MSITPLIAIIQTIMKRKMGDSSSADHETPTHCIKIPIVVECNRNNDFNHNFDLTVPFDLDHPYSVNKLIEDIISWVEERHYTFSFFAAQIKGKSFIGQELNHTDHNWKNMNANLTDYAKSDVIELGMHLLIDIDIYKHNITSFHANVCDEMKTNNDLCRIYAKMRYQNIFSEQYLSHLYEYKHFNQTECKYGDECYAYKRLIETGNDLKDRCHIMIYNHPPRGRQKQELKEGINSFCLNDEWAENVPLFAVTDECKINYTEEDGFLSLLVEEIIDNGFEKDLCLCSDDLKINNYTLMDIVDEKLKCKRHRRMGSPLNRSEMLSLLLYTGGDCNYELCKSQRSGDYNKWKWFDYCLYNAIHKLCKREYGSYKIYTG